MSTNSYHVIFVCLGNICRSPAAENIFRHQVRQAGLEHSIHIDSAGTHDYHPGKAPDKRMSKTLKKRNIESRGAARQFTAQDFNDFDLILTMDRENHANVTRLVTCQEFHEKVVMFTSFCEQPAHQINEVPDPYYGGTEGFELVADMLEDGCRRLLEHVRKEMAQ
jgi:protein-tyrosine phosphatase